MLLQSPVIIQNARQEISNAPLTVISRMRQQACHEPVFIESGSLTMFWINVTMQPLDS